MKRHSQEYFLRLRASPPALSTTARARTDSVRGGAQTEALAEHDISRPRTRERKETQWPVFS
jgi:hypothetical protein